MMTDTQHFVVSIDEGDSQGVYCAYCGKKIIPSKNEDHAGFVFQCHCPDADHERGLYEIRSCIEQDIEKFLVEKTKGIQITECNTRIAVYEQHLQVLKERLQDLVGAPEEPMIILEEGPKLDKIHSFPCPEAIETLTESPESLEDYKSFMKKVALSHNKIDSSEEK